MLCILFSRFNDTNIADSLGLPEYSSYFLLKYFAQTLAALADVRVARELYQVESWVSAAVHAGEKCAVFLFTPPHCAEPKFNCPTYCIFSWPCANLPNEIYGGDPRSDWSYSLSRCNGAIVFSAQAMHAVRNIMGSEYLVEAIPAAIWNPMTNARDLGRASPAEEQLLALRGVLFDSRTADTGEYCAPAELAKRVVALSAPKTWRNRCDATSIHFIQWYAEALQDVVPHWLKQSVYRLNLRLPAATLGLGKLLPPKRIRTAVSTEVVLRGIVYTTVINLNSPRKNWLDIVTAFCWTFREVDTATLLIKMSGPLSEQLEEAFVSVVAQLTPFKCRVLFVHTFLDDVEYAQLIGATTYYVNASNSEGACLPLVEFLSGGKPVIAPRHSALADYIDDKNAFIVDSNAEPTAWPHDPRRVTRALRQRIVWSSLHAAFERSYALATEQPQEYAAMSAYAVASLRNYCSNEVIEPRLQAFLAAGARNYEAAASLITSSQALQSRSAA